ncbi:MAG: ATP-binding protein [Candidatus Saccharimonadales bacterium]
MFLLVSLSLFISFSRARTPIKISFQILTLSLAVWCLANTFADQNPGTALTWTRLAFATGALAVGGLAMFVVFFPKKLTQHSGLIGSLFLGSALLIGAISMTSLIVPRIVYENDYANVVTGELYWLYVSYVLAMVVISIAMLVLKLKKSSGDEAQRVKYVLAGLTLTAVFVLMTNLLLPLFTGSNPLAIYGSFGTLILISLMSYTIIKHSLFSIKVATARAVAYILSGMTLALVFFIIIVISNKAFFKNDSGLDAQQIFYTLSAVTIGLLFPIIQRFFKTLTRRILLRDYYDPEEVLTSIATIISNTRTSKSVLSKVTEEIQSTLNLSFVETYSKADGKWKKIALSGYAAANRVVNADEILKTKNTKIIPLFEAEIGSEQNDEVALLIALKTSQATVGYMLLGYKQNGVGFSKSDYSMLDAIANETAIATENYLRFEEIKELNESLQGRIQDATSKLRVSNKKLQALDKSKDEFISMASHQLRTPLTSVKGYISMVLEGDMGKISTQQRQVLEQAYDSSQRMVFLIGDFLNVSRIQTGKFELEPSTINFTNLVAEEVDQLKETAKMRQMTLVYDRPASDHIAVGDENKLRQVMMNFIDNAIFYSPAGSSIAVHLYKETTGLVFKVVDQGIGVPKEAQSKLFTKFFRASNARQQRPDGTGIGLYMAKKVIIAHSGSIIFETKEGVGSTFGFKLPLEKDLQQSSDQQSSTTNHSGRNSS